MSSRLGVAVRHPPDPGNKLTLLLGLLICTRPTEMSFHGRFNWICG